MADESPSVVGALDEPRGVIHTNAHLPFTADASTHVLEQLFTVIGGVGWKHETPARKDNPRACCHHGSVLSFLVGLLYHSALAGLGSAARISFMHPPRGSARS